MIGHFKMNKDFLVIMEKSQELMFLIGEYGDIFYATAALEKVFGFSQAEYTKFNIRDVIYPDDLADVEDQMKRVTEYPGSTVHFQLRNITKNDGYRWVEGSVTNMLDDGGVHALVAKFRDITDRINAEQQQQELIRDLNKKNQELNQFVYIISHNLRTPLSNLIGLIDILEGDLLDDYNKGIVELFKNSTDRLNETVFDLTHMLGMKDNEGTKTTCIDVRKVFEKVCFSFSEQIRTMGVTIISSFKCTHVLFNKSYLESVLMNLMSNAIKYRDHSRSLEIGISLEHDEQQNCVLTFSDNGTGIDIDANKNELFGLHQRFHNHINGNGVGLFITKSQITSLGGTIDVSSKVNEGTTFSITFRK